MTVFLRCYALTDSNPDVDETLSAKRHGIDGFLSPSDPRCDNAAPVDPTKFVSAATYQQAVAATVRAEIDNVIRRGDRQVIIVAHNWGNWSEEILTAHEMGLIEGFTGAPPRPIDRAFPIITPV